MSWRGVLCDYVRAFVISGFTSLNDRGYYVFSTRKCNTIASNLGKILRGAYDSRASFADDYLASILSL